MSAPGYWMYETSGVLRPAVEAYLYGDELTPQHIAALRAYLRQYINAPAWLGPEIDGLRDGIDSLHSRAQIATWLNKALDVGIDPL